MKKLVVITTNLCNMNCEFCLFYENKKTSIDLGLFKKILTQAKQSGYNRISLTGGEACIHPQFDELIKAVVNEKLDFGIVSNGYEHKRYSDLLKKYKKNFKHITFSLDSHKEELQDKLRKKGSYKKVITAIEIFIKNGIGVSVSVLLNKYNYKDVEDYVYFVEKLNVKDIRFLSVIPTEKNKRFVLTDKKREECCEKINNLRNKVKTQLRIMSSLNTAEGVDFCNALDLSSLAVNPNGELIFFGDTVGDGAVFG